MSSVVGPRWTVVGGGPCGIGAVGRLLDRNCQVTWVDPAFGVGRMGKHYAHVPANTNNRDFIAAFQLNSSFDYVENEQRRIAQGKAAMSTLRDLECYDLGLYVDTFTDFVDILSRRVTAIRGSVIDLHSSGLGLHCTWQVTVKSCDGGATTVHEADAVILCTGSCPILPPSLIPSTEFGLSGICQHNLDEMVCPQYCSDLFNFRDAGSDDLNVLSRDVPWTVIGSSHSAMLVVKNLCEAGVQNIVNFYRSELRFMHAAPNGSMVYPGIGLKGPVGAWVESNLMCTDTDHPIVKRVQSQEAISWGQQLKLHNVGHVVAAVGFRRDDGSLPVVRVADRCLSTSDLDGYDRQTGRIPTGSTLDSYQGPALFGGGIAFPQDIIDGAGHVQPWVGLKRSIEQTDVMVNEYCTALAKSLSAAAMIPTQY